MIGLVLLLLLPTPTIWFSLDHKRNVSDGVVSGIGTLFSLDHKLYASDYDSDSDSDSVASENQPWWKPKQMLASYLPPLPNSNLAIRIAGSSAPLFALPILISDL